MSVGQVMSKESSALSGGYLSVNFGTVVNASHTGKKPDYIGMDLPDKPSAYSLSTYGSGHYGLLIAADITIAGKQYFANHSAGTIAPKRKSGTFAGPAGAGDTVSTTPATGSFTC
jgi:hypothetical protein